MKAAPRDTSLGFEIHFTHAARTSLPQHRQSRIVFFGPYDPEPANDIRSKMGRVARRAMVLGIGWGASSVGLTAASAFALGTLRIGSASYLPHVARTCSKFLLRLQGIEVEIINPELLEGRKPRLVFLNHTSQLDMFLMGSIFPSYGTTLFKRGDPVCPLLRMGDLCLRCTNHQSQEPRQSHRITGTSREDRNRALRYRIHLARRNAVTGWKPRGL